MTGKIFITLIAIAAAYLFVGFILYFGKKKAKEPHKSGKGFSSPDAAQVNSSIYDTDYYLHGYSGDLKEYFSKLENLPIPLRRCFEFARPQPGEKVLDLGCGRGHLSYFCVIKGCIVTAVDYSKDAADLALKTRDALPAQLRGNMTVKQMDFKELDPREKYDVIFMADLLEHLYDWELKILFNKVKEVLKPQTGRLVIHTAPNRIWIKAIFPLKRILDWPTTLRKGRDFWYTRDKYSYDPEMHVNEQTPGSVKRSLRGFDVRVWCDDGSSNLISLMTKKFAGADIWAIARIGSKSEGLK